MQKHENRGGAVLWVILILLVVAGWCGYRIGYLYFDNEAIQNEAAKIADDALVDAHNEPKAAVAAMMQNYGGKVDPEKISAVINEKKDRITLSFPYTRQADLIIFSPPFHFDVSVSREMTKNAGIVENVRSELEDINAAAEKRAAEAVKKAMGGN